MELVACVAVLVLAVVWAFVDVVSLALVVAPFVEGGVVVLAMGFSEVDLTSSGFTTLEKALDDVGVTTDVVADLTTKSSLGWTTAACGLLKGLLEEAILEDDIELEGAETEDDKGLELELELIIKLLELEAIMLELEV